ncbi:MAG: PD-(D/E)XK motif protein, partial [Chitinophagaceae bacterium]
DYIQCLKAWTGPSKAIQDFQFGRWALEVKTTSGKNHQKIYVSSERQLDDSLIPAIFLYHLSLDIRNGNGETLNALIDSIYDLLSRVCL